MSQPNDKKSPTNKSPNWVDKLTLFVLTLTLLVVSIYTREANRQSTLIEKTLEISSRPLLSAAFGNFDTPKTGEKLKIRVIVENLGKTPTKAHLQGTVTYSLTRLESPPLNTQEEIQLVWPNKQALFVIGSDEPISDGQITDMKNGRGWVYARVVVTYDSYDTNICTEYTIQPHPDAIRFITSSVGICKDPKSNDAT